MVNTLGILLAFGALVSWGLGDFLIQRESRLAGTWPSLFYITFIGAVVLTPFVWSDIVQIATLGSLKLLLFTAAITLVVAALEFEAFRRGKIAIVEPIMAFELPLTVLLGVTLGREHLSLLQGLIILVVFVGILLLSHRMTGKRSLLERGALLAFLAAIVMAAVNFFTGTASQIHGPLFTIWFIHAFLAIASFAILALRGQVPTITTHFRAHPWSALAMTLFDNSAWLCYSAAVTIIPISIAITVSESYIVLAILLGIIFNHERIRRYQWFGASVAFGGVLALAFLT